MGVTLRNEEILSRIIRFKDLASSVGVPLMYIDSVLDRHYRINYSPIGATASENEEYRPILTIPHKLQIGMVKAPQFCGPAYHTHDYIESFMPLTGSWRFYFGNLPDQVDGETVIGPGDYISLPAGLWRGFENLTEQNGAWILAIVEEHEIFKFKDPYWAAEIVEQAKVLGFQSDENGKMIKPDEYERIEGALYEKIISMMQ